MNLVDFKSFLGEHEVVFWDWNGTLLDDLDLCVSIIDEFLEQSGYANLGRERYQDIFTIPVYDYYQKLELDKSRHSFEEIGAAFIKGYKSKRHLQPLYPNVKETLSELSSAGTFQVLFSAAHTEELSFQVEHHGLHGVFDLISGASDYEGGSKLERGQQIMEKVGTKKGVIVGDTIHDMEIGKTLGMSTIWVSEGHQSLERVKLNEAIDFIYDRKKEDFSPNQP